MSRRITLEWPSGVWKTTFAKMLEEEKVHRVWEFFHFLEPNEVYPTLNPRSQNELLKTRKRLLNLLKRREEFIGTLHGVDTLVIERSPLTYIYTELARKYHWFLTDICSLARDLLQDYNTLMLPSSFYVFLEAPIPLLVQGVENREGKKTDAFFTDPMTLRIIYGILEVFRTDYLSVEQYSVISNNLRSLKDVSDRIKILLKSNLQNNMQDGVRELCVDILKWRNLLHDIGLV